MSVKTNFFKIKRSKSYKESCHIKTDTDSGCEGGSPTSSLDDDTYKLTVMDCVQKMGKSETNVKTYYKASSIETINIKISATHNQA